MLIYDVRNADELQKYADVEDGIPAPVWSGKETGKGKMMEGKVGACRIVYSAKHH